MNPIQPLLEVLEHVGQAVPRDLLHQFLDLVLSGQLRLDVGRCSRRSGAGGGRNRLLTFSTATTASFIRLLRW